MTFSGAIEVIAGALRAIALGSAVTNTALGGVLTFVGGWVPHEHDLRNRVNFLRDKLYETVNKHLHSLITTAVRDLDPEKLRSATAAKPDLVAAFTVEILRVAHIVRQLDDIEVVVSRAHTQLLVSFCVAAGNAIFILAVDALKPLFAVISILTIGYQLSVVFRVRRHLARLSEYERTC